MPHQISAELVEDALNHLWDFGVLGAHSLGATLKLWSQHGRDLSGHMQRGQALNQKLVSSIEQLKISHGHAGNSRERRYYAILSGSYVDGRTNRDVAEALSVSERTFYRERIRALAVLTRILAEGVDSSSS